MDSIIKEWKELLDGFRDSVDKDVNVIRECKAALQSIRPDYVDNNACGRFIRSNDPIIISSPDIIIGNVDADGNLIGGTPSRILLRGTDIALEGVGALGGKGSVVTKATSIRQIAVDPGIDGQEEVVMPGSEIVNQAGLVSIQSCKGDVFLSESKLARGISIKSDSNIEIDSSFPLAARTQRLNEMSQSLDQTITNIKAALPGFERDVKGLFDELDKALTDADTLTFNNAEISSKVGLLNDLREECERATKELNNKVRIYVRAISILAEATRKHKSVEQALKSLPKEEDYDKNGSGTSVRVNADKLSLSTHNGDGKECVNPDAGVTISSRQVSVSSTDSTGALMEGSKFCVSSMTIDFNATTASYEDEQKTKGTSKSVGDVNIFAKNVNVKAVDAQFDSGAASEADKYKETSLTQGSQLNVRLESVMASTAGTDGVMTGSIMMDTKLLGMTAIDLDKDGNLSKLNDGGEIILTAKTITAGLQDDLMPSTIQLITNDALVESKNSISLNQDGKSSLVVSGDGVSVSSKANLLVGDTTVSGKAKATSLEVPDAKIGNLEVSGQFKSSGLADGFKAPAAGGSEKAQEPAKVEKSSEIKPSKSNVMAPVRAGNKEDKLVELKGAEDK